MKVFSFRFTPLRSSDFPVAGDSQSDLLRKFPLGKKTTFLAPHKIRGERVSAVGEGGLSVAMPFFWGKKGGRSEEN